MMYINEFCMLYLEKWYFLAGMYCLWRVFFGVLIFSIVYLYQDGLDIFLYLESYVFYLLTNFIVPMIWIRIIL